MTEKFRIQVLNQISAHGLRRLPWDQFQISGDGEEPHAILLRSADLHRAVIPASVLAIGRAGAGTNNIPVAALCSNGDLCDGTELCSPDAGCVSGTRVLR